MAIPAHGGSPAAQWRQHPPLEYNGGGGEAAMTGTAWSGALGGGRWDGLTPPIREQCHRYAAAVFTADLAALRERMPSPRLHPVQVWPQRGLVACEATEATWTADGEVLFDLRQLLIGTVVSIGDAPAKPLAPLAEALSTGSIAEAGAGFLELQVLCSSDDAASFFTEILGYQHVAVAEVALGSTDRADWFAASIDGGSALGLAVRNTGVPGRGQGRPVLLAQRDGSLIASRSAVIGEGYRTSAGRRAASVKTGPHPAGDLVRSLGLGRALGGLVAASHESVMATLPVPLAGAVAE